MRAPTKSRRSTAGRTLVRKRRNEKIYINLPLNRGAQVQRRKALGQVYTHARASETRDRGRGLCAPPKTAGQLLGNTTAVLPSGEPKTGDGGAHARRLLLPFVTKNDLCLYDVMHYEVYQWKGTNIFAIHDPHYRYKRMILNNTGWDSEYSTAEITHLAGEGL